MTIAEEKFNFEQDFETREILNSITEKQILHYGQEVEKSTRKKDLEEFKNKLNSFWLSSECDEWLQESLQMLWREYDKQLADLEKGE